MAPEAVPDADLFAIEPLDMAPIGPIDDERPPTPPDAAKKELGKLAFAPPMEDALKNRRYLAVIQTLDKEKLDADKANNLGCAWAWLAHKDNERDYWQEAIATLKKSNELATSDKQRERAKANLTHVCAALRKTAPK